MCECNKQPAFFKGDNSSSFIKAMVETDIRQGWVALYKCPECSTYWRANLWDMGAEPGFIIRIDNLAEWRNYSDKQDYMHYLIVTRGISDKECMTYGCTNKRLKGKPWFCAECDYNKRIRSDSKLGDSHDRHD